MFLKDKTNLYKQSIRNIISLDGIVVDIRDIYFVDWRLTEGDNYSTTISRVNKKEEICVVLSQKELNVIEREFKRIERYRNKV